MRTFKQNIVTGMTAIVASIACATLSNAAPPADYRNIGASPAILYDAPSERGMKLGIAPSGMPVELIFMSGSWCRVRDVSGDLSWVECKAIVARKYVIVKAQVGRVRASADEHAAMAFSTDRFVLLELVDTTGTNWAKVKHKDGSTGYIRNIDIWGI